MNQRYLFYAFFITLPTLVIILFLIPASSPEELEASNIHILQIILPASILLFLQGTLAYQLMSRVRHQSKDSEEWLDTLFDQNPASMLVYDPLSMKILDCNLAAQRIYGYSKEEMQEISVLDLRPEEDLPAFRQLLVSQDGEMKDQGIWRHLKKDGSIFYVKIFSQGVRWHNRSCRLVIALDVDKLQQENANQETIIQNQKRRNEFLNSILKNINQVAWSWNVATEEYTFISQASSLHYGLTPEEMLESVERWYENIHPEDRKKVRTHPDLVIKGGYHAVEYKYRHPDGSLRHIYDRARLVTDELGNPKTIYGISTDITPLRRLNNEIDLTRQNMATLIHSSGDVMILFDKNLELVLANEAFFTALEGFSGQTVTHVEVASLVNLFPKHILGYWSAMANEALEGTPVRVRVPRKYLFSGYEECEVAMEPVEYMGQIVGIACFVRNTTQRKRQENHILSQNQKLRDIAFAQSHEIRPSIANIKGILALINYEDMASPANVPLMQNLKAITEQIDDSIYRIVNSIYELEHMNDPELFATHIDPIDDEEAEDKKDEDENTNGKEESSDDGPDGV